LTFTRIWFEGRQTGKFKAAGKFVERMRKIQEEAQAALKKVQNEEICRQEKK